MFSRITPYEVLNVLELQSKRTGLLDIINRFKLIIKLQLMSIKRLHLQI